MAIVVKVNPRLALLQVLQLLHCLRLSVPVADHVVPEPNPLLPWQEWVGFWNNVIGHGYTEPEAVEELENLEKGEAWVDFDDDRQT